MAVLQWGPLTQDSLPGLRVLARSCLDRYGGLPMLDSDEVLRTLFLTGTGYGARDELGDIVAAAAVAFDATGQRTATGLVHHSLVGEGWVEALGKWAREQAHGAPLHVILEVVSPEAEAFFAEEGLRRTFAEHVMVHRRDYVPFVRRPEGLTLLPFTDDTASAFRSVHRQAFADHPGFTDATFERWTDFVKRGKGFRPQDSRVAFDERGQAVGFVTVSDGWLDQVGVVPEWQGRRLGAHLVVRTVNALRKAGFDKAWLCVSVGNPAEQLYERLGFTVYGTRARYEEPGASPVLGPTPGRPEIDDSYEGSPS